MERIAREFFSMRLMVVALFVFFISIGLATFLETIYDTQTAKLIVYNAKWFELLLVYLTISMIANIFRYKMFRREKIAILMFHLAFIVMMIGAAFTRYASFEGLMIIKEGQTVNHLYSSEPYFWFKVNDGVKQYPWSKQLYMSEITNNYFSTSFNFPNHKGEVMIEYVDYRKNLVDSLVVNDSISETALGFVTNGMTPTFIGPNDFLMIGDVALSYEKKNAMPGIQVWKEGNNFMLQSKLPIKFLSMAELRQANQTGQVADSMYTEIAVDSIVRLQLATLYNVSGQQFVLKEIKKHAKKMLMPAEEKNAGLDYLTVRVNDGGKSKIVEVPGGEGALPRAVTFQFNGLVYEMIYGPKIIELPFAIECRDFQLDRYPGSNSPSSFASEVTIHDKEKGVTRNQRIFMNNVLDYRGYRFFQSGYEPDESGTHLSVNHDWWGTNISYLGYLMMGIGMIMSLFSSGGRMRELFRLIMKTAEKQSKKASILALFVLLSGATFAEGHEGHSHEGHDHATHDQTAGDPASHDHSAEQPEVDKRHYVMTEAHSDELASLLVQFKGKIIPAHSLCDQLIRKVYKKKSYEDLNAVQAIFSMHMYPAYWVEQDVIYVSSRGGWREEIGVEKYCSYIDLIDVRTGQFKFDEPYRKAHQKKESDRDERDKQILKLGERFEIMNTIFSQGWEYIKILPIEGDKGNKWTSILKQGTETEGFKLAVTYLGDLDAASAGNGNYRKALTSLNTLKKHQRKLGKDVVPSESDVRLEISYNKMNIFKNAEYSYLIIGVLFLLIFLVKVFASPTPGVEKAFKWISRILTATTIVIFVYHGVGLYMRSVISGHVPWANAYEAVLFIAWIAVLLGLLLSRVHPVILGAAAILAFFMLFVTELNLFDPEITTLQPVLKSYWLMIHVAIITGSYAPLGFSGILGLMNLVLYVFRTKNNAERISSHISILTYVSEIAMIVGVFMLTIGTFLGGIWANESWGRYWGWDPKETWALVAILVYAVLLHLRYIPSLKDKFTFNALSLWSYSSILFTFFGVNFYLVGLHSYANTEGLGELPSWLIYFVIVVYIFTEFSWVQNKLFQGKGKMVSFASFKKKLIILYAMYVLTGLMIWILGVSDLKTVSINSLLVIALIFATNAIMYGYAYLRTRNSSKAIS